MSERLDRYLVSHGLAKSRERAKDLIKNGLVSVNGRTADKASVEITDSDTVLAGEDHKYVGRGAFKLLKAIEMFRISLEGLVCADIGASTGGFTQVMLEYGAAKVYAIDVGHDQLDPSLRADPRVIDREGTNVRDITVKDFDEPIAFMSVDLSFISLKNVMGVLAGCLADGGSMAVLIKPQFEAGKTAVGKNGVVRSPKEHIRILADLSLFFGECGLCVTGMTFSHIKGGSGNIEYLALLEKRPADTVADVREIVRQAFDELGE